MSRTGYTRRRPSSPTGAAVAFWCSLLAVSDAFFIQPHGQRSFLAWRSPHRQRCSLQMIYAPPGSGYMTADDEESELPDTYEPMMEYPGTMRPGRTRENIPFHDLPIGDDDPEPVPWPHFQQIEWHHRWEPPHPHAMPIEDFIEAQGRWATPEMEAAMRAGARRGVRERREAAEEQKQSTLIMDDDEDDSIDDVPIELGDGVFGKLGSTAEQAVTAAAVAPPLEDDVVTTEEADTEEDASFDDFLLDLGLDAGDVGEVPGDSTEPSGAKGLLDAIQNVDVGDDKPPAVDDDIDLDLDLGFLDGDETAEEEGGGSPEGEISMDMSLDDDDQIEGDFDLALDEDVLDDDGVQMVPLEDIDDDPDSFDTEDDFDDGGFDYDAGDFDNDGGDMW